jgi:hypothetical protein
MLPADLPKRAGHPDASSAYLGGVRQRASRAAGLPLLLLAGLAAFLLLRREAPELGTGDLAEERSRVTAAPAEALVEGAPALEAGGSAVVRPGSVEGARAPRASVGEGDREPSVPVDPKGPFQGVCVDEEDRPVAGATVLVVNGRAGGRGVDRGTFAPARTGTDGRFEIPAPEAVESVRVRASGLGRVAVRADEEMTRGRLARIVLLRAVEVRVRVLEEGTGGAVRGARVSLFAGEENANRGDVDFALHPPTDEAATDETGRAVLLAPGGPCAVLAKARDRAPRLVGPLHVPAASLDVTLVLDRGAALVGFVHDDDARPLAGARVRASTAHLGWRGEATTDADGAFRFEGVPPGPTEDEPRVFRRGEVLDDLDRYALVLVVEADGYPVHTFTREPLSRSGGEWEVYLSRAGPVSGTVEAVVGALPPGAKVRLVPTVAMPEGVAVPLLPPPQAVGPDGSFRFDDVGVLPVEVVVEDASGDRLTADVYMEWPGGKERRRSRPTLSLTASDTQLPVATSWAIRILDPAGMGVVGTGLEVGHGDRRVLHVQGRGTTDAEGRATVSVLGEPPRAGVVYPPGRPAFTFQFSARYPDNWEFPISLPSGRAQGTVRRLDGSGAHVRLAVEAGLGRIAAPETVVGRTPIAVGDDGAFVVAGLGDDDYRISADSPFVLVRPPLVKPGAVLDLRAVTPVEAVSLQVEVRLEPPAGEIVFGGGLLMLQADGGSAYTSELHSTGEPGVWLSAPPMPPGDYRATVASPSYKPVVIPSLRIDGGDRSPRITVVLEKK